MRTNSQYIKRFYTVLVLAGMLLLSNCSTTSEQSNLDPGVGVGAFEDFGSDDDQGFSSIEGGDEFADLEGFQDEAVPSEAAPAQDEFAGFDDFDSANDEVVESQNSDVANNDIPAEFDEFGSEESVNAVPAPVDEFQPMEQGEQDMFAEEALPAEEVPFAEAAPLETEPVTELAPPPVADTAENMDMYTDDLIEPEVAAPMPQEIAEPVVASGSTVRVTDMQYRVNDQGGTLIIQATGPLEYSQRLNAETNQLVIELSNASLPRHLQRPFNTKDFPGQIGFIDAYQLKGAPAPRIVVQLREGAAEPVIQSESNALFVVSSNAQPSEEPVVDMTLGAGASGEDMLAIEGTDTAAETFEQEMSQSPLFSSQNFEDFLRTNQKFYGKRMSIETDEMDLRDIFKLIAEEAGINLVIADDVKGKMSLKLKNVPWDQAIVMIMKAKKLGYTRSGSILRVASMNELRSEEEEALKIAAAKRANLPTRVKTITVNYAKVEDLEKQVRTMLSPKGAVVADPRTSSLVISDSEDHIERAQKLVQSLDIPPQQVLIEGKIVEASDNFEKQIGINWTSSGRAINTGISGPAGAVQATPGLNITPGMPTNSSFGLNFALGTLDILGNLNATLRLFELQGLVKVISSPRILTLHNEKAEIGQTTEIPLITTNISPTGAATPVVNFKPVKLKLEVLPQVTNDGSIIMGIDVTREVIGEIVNRETNARAVNSRSAKTTVMLKNSQTAVIGGIYQNDVTESETRVPGIAKVPVIGWLFKSKSVDKRRTELLIFLTPRILGQMQTLPTAGFDPAPASPDMNIDSAVDFGAEGFSEGSFEDNFDNDFESDFESEFSEEGVTQ